MLNENHLEQNNRIHAGAAVVGTVLRLYHINAAEERFIPEDKRFHNRFRASKPDDVLTIGTEETSRAFIPVRNILYISMGSEADC